MTLDADPIPTRTARPAAAVLAILAVVSTAGVPALAATTTDVTVSPADQELAPGETTAVDVAVATADGGVGAAEFRVALSNASVATVTDVTVHNEPFRTDNAVEDAGADVEFFGANSSGTGTVTVVTVTVEARTAGETEVGIAPNENTGTGDVGLFDRSGAPYVIAGIENATLSVGDGADRDAASPAEVSRDGGADSPLPVSLPLGIGVALLALVVLAVVADRFRSG